MRHSPPPGSTPADRAVMPANCHEMLSSQSQARGSNFSTSAIRLLWNDGM
jgi:hypothetical protein